jgi:hypothetical protein
LATKPRGTPGRRRAAAVQAAATAALEPLLQALAGFVLDSGLSVRELEVLFRSAAVHSVAARQRASGQRVNISGIAATTGIPRAEISQILQAAKRGAATRPIAPSPINRILAAWHEEPGYQKKNGQPLDLRVFGPAPSFEALVSSHGAGLPVRAVLDELVRVGSLTTSSCDLVRAKRSRTSDVLSKPKVSGFAGKAEDLLCMTAETLRANWTQHHLLPLHEISLPEFSLGNYRINDLTTIDHMTADEASYVSAQRQFSISLLAAAPFAPLDRPSGEVFRKHLRRSRRRTQAK